MISLILKVLLTLLEDLRRNNKARSDIFLLDSAKLFWVRGVLYESRKQVFYGIKVEIDHSFRSELG